MSGFRRSAAREQLRAIYTEVDALLAPFSCEKTAECCTFSSTGREPYPTAVELAEIELAIASAGGRRALLKKRLPLAERRCPLLSDDGRCRIHASRPFGCRTFFCDRVRGPGKLPRAELQRLGARIADLSARVFPRDPGPRPLTKAIV
jgi:Fe-S-cluster containining protein